MTARNPRYLAPALAAAIAALTFALFLPVTGYDYVFVDDMSYAGGNPMVRGGITLEGLRWALTSLEWSNWHPLTWISLMLDSQLLGSTPAVHHTVNLVLHALGAVLLFTALARMTGAPRRSAFAAALFAVHPLHVESVAWVTERKDVLSGLFFMLVLLGYERWVRRGGTARYLATALFLALGLMSKAMLVSVPLVLLLVDFWPLGRLGAGEAHDSKPRVALGLVREKWLFFLLAAAAASLGLLAQAESGAVGSLAAFPLSLRFQNAVISLFLYVRNTVWPSSLAFYYPYPSDSIPWWATAGSLLVLGAATAAALRWRRRPYLLAGWLWFLVMILPVVGLVQLGFQAMADRYTYLPLIGLFLAVSWGGADLFGGRKAPAGILLGAVSLLALCVATSRQLPAWRDSHALLDRAISVTPESGMAHHFKGILLLEEGEGEEALAHLRESARLTPGSALAQYTLAVTLLNAGRSEEAVPHFLSALETSPSYADAHGGLAAALENLGRAAEAWDHYLKAVSLSPLDPNVNYALGRFLVKRGDYQGGARALARAVEAAPGDVELLLALAAALESAGDEAEAEKRYRELLRLSPGNFNGLSGLGVLLAKKGGHDEARSLLESALRADPRSAAAHYNLARVLEIAKEPGEAEEHYRESLRLDPSIPRTHNDLGVLLSGAGKKEEAESQFEEALRLDPGYGPARENLRRLRRAWRR